MLWCFDFRWWDGLSLVWKCVFLPQRVPSRTVPGCPRTAMAVRYLFSPSWGQVHCIEQVSRRTLIGIAEPPDHGFLFLAADNVHWLYTTVCYALPFNELQFSCRTTDEIKKLGSLIKARSYHILLNFYMQLKETPLPNPKPLHKYTYRSYLCIDLKQKYEVYIAQKSYWMWANCYPKQLQNARQALIPPFTWELGPVPLEQLKVLTAS